MDDSKLNQDNIKVDINNGNVNSDDEVENYDYDTNNYDNFPKAGKGVTLKELQEGVEFETESQVNQIERQESEEQVLWSREELEKYLGSDPRPEELTGVEDTYSFDERISMMEAIIPEGVYKRVLRQGSGAVVSENSSVLYNLNAFLPDSPEPFDSTWLRGKPYLHRLKSDTIIEGVFRCLLTMRRGERCELIVRPRYAYLDMGCPPRVPANSTVLYIIEVIKIYEEGTLVYFDSLSWEDKQSVSFDRVFDLCNTERVSANTYFKDKRFTESAVRYRRAIRCLQDITFTNDEHEARAKQLLLKLYNNIALTYNRLQKPITAMHNCKKALQIDDTNAKALYIYAYANYMNGDYQLALEKAKRAQQFQKEDQLINTLLQKIDRRIQEEHIMLDDLHKKMAKGLFVSADKVK